MDNSATPICSQSRPSSSYGRRPSAVPTSSNAPSSGRLFRRLSMAYGDVIKIKECPTPANNTVPSSSSVVASERELISEYAFNHRKTSQPNNTSASAGGAQMASGHGKLIRIRSDPVQSYADLRSCDAGRAAPHKSRLSSVTKIDENLSPLIEMPTQASIRLATSKEALLSNKQQFLPSQVNDSTGGNLNHSISVDAGVTVNGQNNNVNNKKRGSVSGVGGGNCNLVVPPLSPINPRPRPRSGSLPPSINPELAHAKLAMMKKKLVPLPNRQSLPPEIEQHLMNDANQRHLSDDAKKVGKTLSDG